MKSKFCPVCLRYEGEESKLPIVSTIAFGPLTLWGSKFEHCLWVSHKNMAK